MRAHRKLQDHRPEPERLVQAVPSQHPGLRGDKTRPSGKGRDRAQVLADVLPTGETHRNDPAIGLDEGRPKENFEHEETLGMASRRTVPGVENWP